MNAMSTELAHVAPSNPLVPKSLDEAARLAKIMSDMSLVPEHLRGKPADCMLIVEQAHRWRMSPFAVAQATSVLQGKLNFEGKLVAAALNTSGVLATRLRYDYSGAGEARQVKVSAVLSGETEPREVVVDLAKVKTGNKMWTSQPDQQLSYAGARIWARRHVPEVMLGVYAPEEFDAQPHREPPHAGPTLDAKPEPYPKAPTRPRDAVDEDAIPDFDAPPPPAKDKLREAADRIKAKLTEAHDQDSYNAVMGNSGIAMYWDRIRAERPELADELEAHRAAQLERIADVKPPGPTLPWDADAEDAA